MEKFEKVFNIAKRRGFFTVSNEIYNPPAGFYDFGPLGALLKHNLENLWRREIILKEGFHEVETVLICPEEVFIASGHVAQFNDPLTECTKCHKRFRADHLIRDQAKVPTDGLGLEQLTKLIHQHGVKCPECKGSLTDVNMFNMMFKTSIGASEPKTAYVRPETAQGMFVNFKFVLGAVGGTLPIGIAQIGRSFRNEISPRQGMIRLRELNQAEVEIFALPDQLNNHPRFSEVAGRKLNLLSKQLQAEGKQAQPFTVQDAVKQGIIANQWIAYHLVKAWNIYKLLGITDDKLRCRQHLDKERAHYSKDCWDLEVMTDFGWVEVIGCAYRTDYDLAAHINLSKADLYYVTDTGQKIIPHVVEPSYGIDRMLYCTMEHALREEEGRTWLAFPAIIAPVKVQLLPIVKDEGMESFATKLKDGLIDAGVHATIAVKDSLGKRYMKADEVGVPYCVTVDRQTLEDDTVTIRDRDSRKQVRLGAKNLVSTISSIISGTLPFEKAGTLVERPSKPETK